MQPPLMFPVMIMNGRSIVCVSFGEATRTSLVFAAKSTNHNEEPVRSLTRWDDVPVERSHNEWERETPQGIGFPRRST